MQATESASEMLLILIFGFTVMGGAITAYLRLADKDFPVDTGLLHGRMGVVAAVIFALLILSGDAFSQARWPALVLFSVVILLGISLYFIIRRRGVLPLSIILLHGGLAVSGLLALLSVWSFSVECI